jgi:hypothetical protein
MLKKIDGHSNFCNIWSLHGGNHKEQSILGCAAGRLVWFSLVWFSWVYLALQKNPYTGGHPLVTEAVNVELSWLHVPPASHKEETVKYSLFKTVQN